MVAGRRQIVKEETCQFQPVHSCITQGINMVSVFYLHTMVRHTVGFNLGPWIFGCYVFILQSTSSRGAPWYPP